MHIDENIEEEEEEEEERLRSHSERVSSVAFAARQSKGNNNGNLGFTRSRHSRATADFAFWNREQPRVTGERTKKETLLRQVKSQPGHYVITILHKCSTFGSLWDQPLSIHSGTRVRSSSWVSNLLEHLSLVGQQKFVESRASVIYMVFYKFNVIYIIYENIETTFVVK